jgi:hypothetical protein
MANTFELIYSATVGSGGAASIDFTVIPSTFTDLCVLVSARQSGAAITASLNMSLNGSTSSFTYKALQGAGSGTPTSFAGSTNYIGQSPAATATASTFGNAQIYIPNYAGATNKSISIETVDELNGTTTYAQLTNSLWSNTAAINALSVISGNGVFSQYTTAYLYGVINA